MFYFVKPFQDVVEHLAGLFKNDFSSYRDILQNLPDLQHIAMAAINRKIRPSDFAKMISGLKKVADKLDRLSENSTETDQRSRPEPLSRILAAISKSFKTVKDLTEPLDLDAASKNDFQSIFVDPGQFAGISAVKDEIERLVQRLDDHKPEICQSLGVFSFSYASVSGLDYLVEVSPPTKKVPNNWTR